MSEYADTDANISERRHDPLCRYRDDEWLDAHDCGECNLITRVRADEWEKWSKRIFDFIDALQGEEQP